MRWRRVRRGPNIPSKHTQAEDPGADLEQVSSSTRGRACVFTTQEVVQPWTGRGLRIRTKVDNCLSANIQLYFKIKFI